MVDIPLYGPNNPSCMWRIRCPEAISAGMQMHIRPFSMPQPTVPDPESKERATWPHKTSRSSLELPTVGNIIMETSLLVLVTSADSGDTHRAAQGSNLVPGTGRIELSRRYGSLGEMANARLRRSRANGRSCISRWRLGVTSPINLRQIGLG